MPRHPAGAIPRPGEIIAPHEDLIEFGRNVLVLASNPICRIERREKRFCLWIPRRPSGLERVVKLPDEGFEIRSVTYGHSIASTGTDFKIDVPPVVLVLIAEGKHVIDKI